jgi:hypothetical protein
MHIKILATEDKSNGRLYKIDAEGSGLQLLFTWHSLGRITFWNLSVEQVLEALLYPDEVVIGHFNRYITHKRHNGNVIRAVYEYNDDVPVLITVYKPSADRYFEGGGKFADKILS